MDDTDLRRQLGDTIGTLVPPRVPLEEITRRGRVITRRRAGLAVVAVAGAAAAVLALLPGGLSIRSAPPPATSSQGNPTELMNYPAPRGWDLFAAGTANGHPWRLNVADVADSGGACIPAVVLNGQDADLLLPHPDLAATPAGAPSVLSGIVGAPVASFAFFRVPPSVTRLVVSAGPAVRLTLTPVTETVCGRRFRVAGFGFDFAEPVRVTAYPSGAGYVLPVSLIKPSPYPEELDGQWQNLDQSAGLGTPHRVTGGTIAGRHWNIDLRLGDQGACFSLNVPSAAGSGKPGCIMVVVGNNQPMYEMGPAVIASTRLYGYAFPRGTQDWSSVDVHLTDGQTVTVTPVTVSGLRVVAFAVVFPATGFTIKDAAGNVVQTGPLTGPGS